MASTPERPTTFGELPPSNYPGERLGLPQTGPRSVGRLGRRLAALAIDWGIGVVISLAFFRYEAWAIYLFFVLANVLFIPTIGGSIGHRLLGMRVVPIAGGYVGWWRPLVRTGLLCLVIPALVWDSDQRGFHDKVAQTVLLRGA